MWLFVPFFFSLKMRANIRICDETISIYYFELNNLFPTRLKHQKNIICSPNTKRIHPYGRIWNALYKKFNNNNTQALQYFADKVQEFKDNVNDDQSMKNLEFLEKCLYYDYYCGEQYKIYNVYQAKHNKEFDEEIPSLKKKYIGMSISRINQEVYYSHHGLRFSSDKIKGYLKDKDLFDVGSYNGDSCLVLHQYTNKKVHSYDNSIKMINQYRTNVERNHIPKEKYENNYIQLGSVIEKNENGLSKSTIDEEVKSKGLVAGLIKADVEGGGFQVIKGSVNTLKEQHPVIIIAIYHCVDEMFGIFDLLKNEIGGYMFEFHCENSLLANLCEFCIFAYPKSLMN